MLDEHTAIDIDADMLDDIRVAAHDAKTVADLDACLADMAVVDAHLAILVRGVPAERLGRDHARYVEARSKLIARIDGTRASILEIEALVAEAEGRA